MAAPEIVDTLPVFTLDANDFAQFIKSIAMPFSRAELNDATFGDATALKTKGLKQWGVTLTAEQDYAATKFDVWTWALVDGEAVTAMINNPRGSGSGEPTYTANAHAMAYDPFSAGHGDKVMSTLVLSAGGNLSRAAI